MTEITAHTNLIEITGWTKDGTWQTVDLTPFLTHTDPKIVALKKYASTNDRELTIGVRPVGSAIVDARSQHRLATDGGWQYRWMDVLVALNGSNEVQLSSDFAGGKVYLEAEFGGDNVIALSDWTNKIMSAPAAWADVDVSTEITGLGDSNWKSGGQFSVLLYCHTGTDGKLAYRMNGGVYNNPLVENHTTCHMGCVQLDENDIFEIYVQKITGASASYCYIVGFIKNFVSHDPGNQTWAGTGWQTHEVTICNNASGGIDSYVNNVVALIHLENAYNSAPAFTVYARAVGSTNTARRILGGVRDMWVSLNSSQQLQVNRNNTVTVNYEVKGFYEVRHFFGGTSAEEDMKKFWLDVWDAMFGK